MTEFFETTPGFCPLCGSIFPAIKTLGNVICYNCKKEFNPNVFGSMEVEYKIHFNTYSPTLSQMKKSDENNETDGPLVERKCPKCDSNKMSYATVQLRSADEGQTVFFTCIKCKFKESENS